MLLKEAIIRKTKDKEEWCVFSKKKNPKTGQRRNMGCYPSKKGAKERIQQVETFKHAEALLDESSPKLIATTSSNYLRRAGEFLRETGEDAGMISTIEVARISLATISKKEMRKWLEMTPQETRKLTPIKLYNILAEIIPEIDTLQRQLEDLTYILDMCKDEKIVPLTKRYKSKVLQFREILVGTIQAPNVNVHAVLKILEKKHPELRSQIASIKKRKTTIITRLVKTTTSKLENGNPQKFPTSTPPYEVLGESLMKVAGMVDTLRLLFHKLRGGVVAVWEAVKRELSGELDELYDSIGNATGVLSSMTSELEALL